MVKRLRSEHLKEFRKLNQLFAQAFEQDDIYLGKKPSDSYLQKLLGQDHVITLVTLDQDQVVAGLVAYVLEKFEQERSEVYIYDLAVDQNYRRKGLATQLIEALKNEVQKYDSWVIFVQADHGDEPAIKLYESLGKREEVLHFDIPVT